VSARLMTQLLGYAGLMPFYGFLYGMACLNGLAQSVSHQGFVIYSLAIQCFVAGTLWGSAALVASEARLGRLVVSNGVVLFAVAAVLIGQLVLAGVLLILGYLALVWYERRVSRGASWYLRLRAFLTVGVVVAHCAYVALQIVQA